MRRIGIALFTATLLAVGAIAPAAAHVHGLTPLRCVGVADDGANRVNDTPASAVVGGLIPRDVGRAPLTVGDGGFDTPACPAP